MTTPVLRVVAGGEPTDEELAALVSVVTLLKTRTDDAPSRAATGWADSARAGVSWRRDGWLAFSRRAALRRGL